MLSSPHQLRKGRPKASTRRLKRDRAVLAVIDVQEKLAAVIHEQSEMQRKIEQLVRGCHILGVPALLTEQYPKGIGPTTETVQRAFSETYGGEPIQKICFSSADCAEFAMTLKMLGRKQVLLAGIETHVCVYQTAIDLLDEGREVHLVVDATSSRSPEDKRIAIERLQSEGVKLTSVEMALFELTTTAGTDEFKAIAKLVK